MPTIKFAAKPHGVCGTCLSNWRPGKLHVIEGGPTIYSTYCEHDEVGGWGFVENDTVRQWHIRVPIDALEWQRYLESLPRCIAGARAAMEPAPDGDLH